MTTRQGSLTIQAYQKDQLTFQTNEQARFYGRNSSDRDLEDLQAGMIVLIGAKYQGSGQFLAQAVLRLK